MTKTVLGSELKVGDAVRVLGRNVRIIAMTPYDNDFARSVWPEGGVRLATFDIGGGITVEPHARFDLLA